MVLVSDRLPQVANSTSAHLDDGDPIGILQEKFSNLAVETITTKSVLSKKPKADNEILGLMNIGGRRGMGRSQRQLNKRNAKLVIKEETDEDDEVEEEEEEDEEERDSEEEKPSERGCTMRSRQSHRRDPYRNSKPCSPSTSSESSQGSSPGSSPRRDAILPHTIKVTSSMGGSTCSIFPVESQADGSSSSSSSSPTKVIEPPFRHLSGGGLVVTPTTESHPPSASSVLAAFPQTTTTSPITITLSAGTINASTFTMVSPGNRSASVGAEQLRTGSPFSHFPDTLGWRSTSPATTDDSSANSPFSVHQEQFNQGVDQDVLEQCPGIPVAPQTPSSSELQPHSRQILQPVVGDYGHLPVVIEQKTAEGIQDTLSWLYSQNIATENLPENLLGMLDKYIPDGFSQNEFDDIPMSDLEVSASQQATSQVHEVREPCSIDLHNTYLIHAAVTPSTPESQLTTTMQGCTSRFRKILPKPLNVTCVPGNPPSQGAVAGASPVVPYATGKEQLLACLKENDKYQAIKQVDCRQIDIVKQDSAGDTNLHIAIGRGNAGLHFTYAIVEKLLLLNKSIDTPNRKGQTPLFVAVAKNHLILVNYLLNCGANANSQCKDGNSLLHLVAMRGQAYYNVGNSLCKAPNISLNQRNSKGYTPLHCAVKIENLDDSISIIQLLLKSGADLDFPDSCNGKTALHMAVERGSLEMVTAICESTVISNHINHKCHAGTALHFAAMLNNIDESVQHAIVEVLLKHGANRALKNDRDHKCPKDLVVKQRTKVKELLNKKR